MPAEALHPHREYHRDDRPPQVRDRSRRADAGDAAHHA